MDMTWLLDFLSEHIGTLLIGLEVFILNLLGKKPKLTSEEKKAKAKAKKEAKARKAVAKAQSAMREVEELEKEEN